MDKLFFSFKINKNANYTKLRVKESFLLLAFTFGFLVILINSQKNHKTTKLSKMNF